MKIFVSDWILPIVGKPIRKGALVINDQGKIIDIGIGSKILDKYKVIPHKLHGYLMPGLINAHTHLELSGLKGKIELKGDGLGNWLSRLNDEFKQFNILENRSSIIKAVSESVRSGVIAVGDISNSCLTIDILLRFGLKGIIFLEVYDGLGEESRIIDISFINKWNKNNRYGLFISPTPHSLYSTSAKLINEILKNNIDNKRRTSMHWKESPEEIRYITYHNGPLDKIMKRLWPKIKRQYDKNILSFRDFTDNFFNPKTILVHNVTTNIKELKSIKKNGVNLVLCPRSNINISGILPPVKEIINSNINFALGTDSLASVDDLDLRKEVVLLRNSLSFIPPHKMLESITINGAKALGFQNILGSLEIGKSPGILHVETEKTILYPEKFLIDNIEKLKIKRVDEQNTF